MSILRPSLAHGAAMVFVLALAALAHAGTWSWFVEPFSVDLATTHPEAGAMQGRIVVDAHALRTEWTIGGMVQVTIAKPEGDAVRVWALLPDGSASAFVLTGTDAYELLVQGYVPVVTAPEDPRHPCTASPETHRCTFEADEVIDGRTLERWRIASDTRDGRVHGQQFWFDREAELVMRALDDTGADLVFSNHQRGPVDQAAFEVP